jgi:hypothetical protein
MAIGVLRKVVEGRPVGASACPFASSHQDRFTPAASGAAIAARDGIQSPMEGRSRMTLGMILLIVVILLLIGAIPRWPHSRSWGYGPSGGLGLVLVIIIVLVLLGKI